MSIVKSSMHSSKSALDNYSFLRYLTRGGGKGYAGQVLLAHMVFGAGIENYENM